jgi:MYXO-CTERM domain-containing protein
VLPGIFGSLGSFEFTQSVQLPPLASPGSRLTLTAPFVLTPELFSGLEVFCVAGMSLGPCPQDFGLVLDLVFSGQGIGSITFRSGTEAWTLDDTTYDFAPTPESMTPLLWATSAAGLGWALRRRRRLTEAAETRP